MKTDKQLLRDLVWQCNYCNAWEADLSTTSYITSELIDWLHRCIWMGYTE